MKTQRICITKWKRNIRQRNKPNMETGEDIAGLHVKVKAIDFVVNPWGDNNPNLYNHIYNGESREWEQCPQAQYTIEISKNGGKAQEFQFTDSIHAFENRKPLELGSALACVLGDAQTFSYVEAVDDWDGAENVMNEFGYVNLKKARDIYRALHEVYLKIKTLLTEQEVNFLLEGELEQYR